MIGQRATMALAPRRARKESRPVLNRPALIAWLKAKGLLLAAAAAEAADA